MGAEEKLVNCPKCKSVSLLDGTLAGNLAVKHCTDCKGTWIPSAEYEAWQAQQPELTPADPESIAQILNVDFVQSPFDTKAALCPECGRYLSRAKVRLKTPFYVERCLNCSGIWCDRGEWEVLSQLGLHTTIEQLFSSEWQIKVEKQQQSEKEREATMEKLGPELAARVFELAEQLAKHPNGDFGVAYLMRQVGVTK